MPAGNTYGNIVFSWSNIPCSSSSGTDSLITGNNCSEGVLGSHPNAVCQIYFAPRHTAIGCPQRYTPSQNVPAFATFNAVDANESVWYPDRQLPHT